MKSLKLVTILFSKITLGLILLFSLFSNPTTSTIINAQPPVSSIWTVEFSLQEGASKTIEDYRFLSDFNKGGYNNQVWFTDENTLLFSAAKGTNTNIYKADLAAGSLRQITDTEESEFSPQLIHNGAYYNWVRLEKDGTQRLWQAPADHSNNGFPLTSIDLLVGYYQWIEDDVVALFVLRENHNELVLLDLKNEREKFLARNPGRSLQLGNDGLLYYTVQRSQNNFILYSYDHSTGNSQMIIRLPAGSTGDISIGPDGYLLTFSGEYLLGFRPGTDSSWRNLIRLRGMENQKLSRLSYNGNGVLAFVAEEN